MLDVWQIMQLRHRVWRLGKRPPWIGKWRLMKLGKHWNPMMDKKTNSVEPKVIWKKEWGIPKPRKYRRKVRIMPREQLKPCPLCGGRASIVDDTSICCGVSITCTKCNMELHRKIRDSAIQGWNKRVRY